MTPGVIVVVGPTATGKSALAAALAERIGAAEIINADSRQVLRGLAGVTAAPDAASMAAHSMHLYGVVDPGERFTVADWLQMAAAEVERAAAADVAAIVVGGTGLYVSALLDGLDALPDPDLEKRAARNARAAEPDGLRALVSELAALDPAAPAGIDVKNPRRVVRALEIVEASGKPLAAHRTRVSAALPATTRYVGIDIATPGLIRRIGARAAQILNDETTITEVESLRRTLDDNTIAGLAIGCAEIISLLDGRIDKDAAIEALAARTLRYARSQRTFFRRDTRLRWLDGDLPLTALVDAVLDEASVAQ